VYNGTEALLRASMAKGAKTSGKKKKTVFELFEPRKKKTPRDNDTAQVQTVREEQKKKAIIPFFNDRNHKSLTEAKSILKASRGEKRGAVGIKRKGDA